MSLTVSKTTFENHPQGSFLGKISTVEEEDSEYGPRVKMVIETDQIGENEQPLDIWHFCSKTFSKKSKLGRTVSGILGCKFAEIPDDFDLESLAGKQTQITVEHTQSESGREYSKVVSFLPSNGGSSNLSEKMINRLKELMSQNNVDTGILDSYYDVDAIEKLSKSQAIEFGKKMVSGEITFKLPNDSQPEKNDEIPF